MPVTDGSNRRRLPVHEEHNVGLRVMLSRVQGLTDPKVLKQPFVFQCAPLDSMPREMAWQWTDYVTLGSGYHSQPNAANLETWSFTTLFVDDDQHHSFTRTKDNRHVLDMVGELKAIGDSLTPFLLTFGQSALWGRQEVVSGATLRALHSEERHGEPDARYITVSFTEFPDVPPQVTPSDPTGSGGGRPPRNVIAVLNSAKLPPRFDTMAKLAKHYYGAVSGWRLIAKASGLTKIGPNTNLREAVGRRHPPAKIVIPRKPHA